LAVGGSVGNKTILLTPADSAGDIKVKYNGTALGSYHPTGHILVYGQAGNDIIQLKSATIGTTTYYITVPAFLYGGSTGNDILDARGSTANNVLTGGGGKNTLYGGRGRDLLIAGTGAATLNAGVRDDLLIGGSTNYDIGSTSGMTYDQQLATLHAIMAEWGSADSYATRLSALAGYLNTNTVHDNSVNGAAVLDQLYGNSKANDWFFAGVNDYLTRTNNDVITTIK